MLKRPALRLALILAVAGVLPACGGGGSSGSPAVNGTVQLTAVAVPATEGGGTVLLSVSRVGGNRAVSVNYATSAGSAVIGTDYSTTNGTLNWAAADLAPKPISVPLGAVDAALDGPRTFTVTLSAPTGAILGANVAAVVTIADADTAGVVEFASATASPTEGDGAINLSVTRTGGTVAVSLPYTFTAGTAATPGDFTGVNGTLTWAAGDVTAQNIPVTIAAADAALDGPRTFTVGFGVPTGATVGTNAACAVTIADADTAGVVQFALTTATAAEGSGALNLSVSRTGGTVAIDIPYTFADVLATNGQDYTGANGTLSFGAAEAGPKNISVTIDAAEGLFEGSEDFTVTLGAPTGATLGANTVMTVTVTETDPPPPVPGVVAITVGSITVAEGPGAFVTLTVTRTGGDSDITVEYTTQDGSATTADSDYTFASGTFSWLAGDSTNRTITVFVSDIDSKSEGNESFIVKLQNPTAATISAAFPQTTVTIDDGDAPVEGVFALSAAVYDVTEPAAGSVNVTVTVTRSSGSTGPVQVEVLVGGGASTATVGADYTDPNPVLLTWTDLESGAKTFTIAIQSDGLDAAAYETIALTLQNPSIVPAPGLGPEISPSAGSAVVRILDRDQIGQLQFSAPTYSVSEAGLQATIAVQRVNGASGAISVPVTVGGGSAVAGVDYVDPNPITDLAWADGDTADKSIVILVNDNNIGDGNRTVEITLGTPSIGTVAGTNPAVLTITDDEAGSFVFSSPTYSQIEGNAGAAPLTITVNRVNGSTGAATVDVVVTGGTATAGVGNDYVLATPVPLSFADGETSKTFDISILGDTTFEPNETILLGLQNATGASVGAPGAATVTITNDELPPGGTIRFLVNTFAVNETDLSVTITLDRSDKFDLPASVTFRTLNGTAKGNGNKKDFTAVNKTVNFLAGESSKMETIFITNDTTVEVIETFRVQLSAPTGNAVLGTFSTATVSITSED